MKKILLGLLIAFFIIELCTGIWLATHFQGVGEQNELYFGNEYLTIYMGVDVNERGILY